MFSWLEGLYKTRRLTERLQRQNVRNINSREHNRQQTALSEIFLLHDIYELLNMNGNVFNNATENNCAYTGNCYVPLSWYINADYSTDWNYLRPHQPYVYSYDCRRRDVQLRFWLDISLPLGPCKWNAINLQQRLWWIDVFWP